jgi:DNA polymerase-3 subunit delta'
MPLNDLVGHQELFERLRGELRRRPSHGYLLWGPRGIGKELLAEALALSLLCERRPEQDFCCDLLHCPNRAEQPPARRGRTELPSAQCQCCTGCVQLALRVHPDFDYVARGAQRSFVLIEQVRELIAQLGHKPVRAGRRVAIIDDAEALNLAAQNALLKTLEEPPGYAIVFLVAESESALLDTVRSRLRPVRVPPLTVAALTSLLTGKAKLDPARANALARLARGSAARALALAGGTMPPVAELLGALKDARGMTFVDARVLAERLFNSREDAADHLELLARLLQDLLHRKLGAAGDAGQPAPPDSTPADDISALSTAAARALSRDDILVLLDLTLHTAARVEAMANPRLQAEGLWISAGETLRQLERDRT